MGFEIGNTAGSVGNFLGSSYDFGLNIYNKTWGAVEDFGGIAGRHAIDSVPGMGLPSHTWNSRNAYRTDYTPTKRAGAALGDFSAIAMAGVLAYTWRRSGFSVGNLHGAALGAARLGGALALGAGAISGGYKAFNDVIDDGHLGGLGLATASLGTMFLLRHSRPKTWPGIGVAAATLIAAGAAGWIIGKQAKFSDGHVGEPAEADTVKLEGKLLPLGALRGFWNHFLEESPATPGVTFGNSWREPRAFREDYSDHERFGGMAGDLTAAVIGGTSGLVVMNRVLGRNSDAILHSKVARFANTISVPGRVIDRIRDVGRAKELVQSTTSEKVSTIADNTINHPGVGEQTAEQIKRIAEQKAVNFRGKVPQLLYLAGIGLAGYTIYDAWDHGDNNKNGFMSGELSAGVAAAFIGIGAIAIAKTVPFVKNLPGKTKPAVALLTASAVGAGASMLRSPIESYIDEALYMHKRHPITNPLIAAGISGLGAVAGAYLGFKAANLMAFQSKGRMIGAAMGTVAGALAGFGMAPFIASNKTETVHDNYKKYPVTKLG